jgi:hypothetical protein
MPAVLEPVRFSLIALLVAGLTLLATCVGGMACGVVVAKAQPPQRDLSAAMLAWLSLPHERPDGTHPFVAHCRQRRGGCEAYVRRYALLFETYAARGEIDPYLVAAVALHESALNEDAIGRAGETSVMQVNPRSRIASWVRRWCRTSPSDCDAIHVQGAVSVLATAIRSCGGEACGLVRYNSGRAEASSSYSRAVLALRDRLRGEA